MIDLDRTMFYKAKFDIEAEPSQDALWSLVMTLRDWTLRKAERDGYSMPKETSDWTALKNGDTLRSPDADVMLYSALFAHDGVYTWACQHIENVKARDYAPRRWITEVGFEGHSRERGAVSVITMYSDQPGFVGPLQETPSASVPGLIGMLLRNPRLVCTVDGHHLQNGAREFDAASAEKLHSLLSDSAREVPVILISPTRAGELLLDPNEVSRLLGPNALVFFARDNEAMDALNRLLAPSSLQCYGGAIRIYSPRPHFDLPGDHYNHRFFTPRRIHEQGAGYHYAILRRALAEDVYARETSIRVDDVKRLRRRSVRERTYERRAVEIQDMALEQVADLVESAEEERDVAVEELKDYKQRLFEAEDKARSLEQALQGQRSEDDPLSHVMAETSSLTIPSVGKLFVSAFPDRLDFSERGWHSLEECTFEPKTFWRALHDMCVILHPLYAEGRHNIADEFNSRSSFILKPGEGITTRENSQFMREREDEYQGRRLFIEPHIASREHSPKRPQFIRIYFNWDEESRLLVIGDTKHLTNSMTRKL